MKSTKKKALPNKAKKPVAPTRAPLVILTNLPNDAKSTMMKHLYNAFSMGKIGLIDGMDPDTLEVRPMLAGIEMEDGELVNVIPFAVILETEEEMARILIADGKGNYVKLDGQLSNEQPHDGGVEARAEEEGGASIEQEPPAH